MRKAWWAAQVFVGTHFRELMFLFDLVLTLVDIAECISAMR